MTAGKYDLRVTILVWSAGGQEANGEEPESWAEPAAGTGQYFAARDSLSAGESIVQGIRQATGLMKVRIKGRAIPVAATDRLRVNATGEAFGIVSVSRDKTDTILDCERVTRQAVGQ